MSATSAALAILGVVLALLAIGEDMGYVTAALLDGLTFGTVAFFAFLAFVAAICVYAYDEMRTADSGYLYSPTYARFRRR
jgi:predicted lipid-binding transport protein (Tim44 family)